MRTSFSAKSGSNNWSDTILTHESGFEAASSSEDAENNHSHTVKFPERITYRNGPPAVIYGKSAARATYRVAWQADGRRQMKSFAGYGGDAGALKFARGKAKDLKTGNQVVSLTPSQASDAVTAIKRLQRFFEATAQHVNLATAVDRFCEAQSKLDGALLVDAVEKYVTTIATVKREDVSKAVELFITAEEPRTKSSDGQRPQLSAKYHYNRAIMLRRFAAAFPGHAVCDLGREHLDAFLANIGGIKSKSRNKRPAASPKVRNHYRAAIRQFLTWAVRKDYLLPTHRLLESDGLRPEKTNGGKTEFYTPKEFRSLLDAADDEMRPIIAIGGLAGLRTSELLALDWSEVWRVPGHIEVTAGKAKTRQRRLVEICPVLARWLQPYRQHTSGKVCTVYEITFQQHFVDLCEKSGVTRKANGLRHAFCTYHFAMHANENQTAAQAGNSPAMIHAHYRGLATRQEAHKWFGIRPAKTKGNIVSLDLTMGNAVRR